MALTEVIEAELLAALDSGANVTDILRQYGGSKGPLYAALARATARATDRLASLQAETTKARATAKAAAERASAAEQRLATAEEKLSEVDRRLAEATAALKVHREAVARVEALAARGLDANALAQLGNLLERAAKAAGTSPTAAMGTL